MEAIHLVCGARRSQLMGDPLGGGATTIEPTPLRPAETKWLRTRRSLRWYRALLYTTIALLLVVTFLAFSHPVFGSIFGVVLWIVVGEVILISWKITSWPCPRCGKPFFPRTIMLDYGFFPAMRKCAHCGLPWREAKKVPFAPA